MNEAMGLDELADRLVRGGRLSQAEASHLIDEVLAYLSESIEQFVRRRHVELQREGYSNRAIYERLAIEASQRRFVAPALTQRQIRRLIYG